MIYYNTVESSAQFIKRSSLSFKINVVGLNLRCSALKSEYVFQNLEFSFFIHSFAQMAVDSGTATRPLSVSLREICRNRGFLALDI